MDTYLKLSCQTAGKDKLARLIQYGCKLLAYLIGRLNRVELADQLRHLEFHFGTFRKLLRLGKSAEVLYSTLKTLHVPDIVLRSLLTLSKIAQALFLLFDHILWIGRVGLMKINSQKWSRLANRCWLYSITLHLLRDMYEMKLHLRNQQLSALPQPSSNVQLYSMIPSSIQMLIPHTVHVCLNRRDIALDTAKNICDIFIPLSYEGHININAGIIGLLGVLSSIAGIAAVVDPSVKLYP